MLAVDTNILIAAAVEEAEGHAAALAWVEALRAGRRAWFVTWAVVYEMLRVATHPRVFPHPLRVEDAWHFVDELRASPSFGVLTATDRHAAVLGDLVREYPRLAGNILHDLHTVALMREHGVREIHTADRDFLRFRDLRVVNPLAA